MDRGIRSSSPTSGKSVFRAVSNPLLTIIFIALAELSFLFWFLGGIVNYSPDLPRQQWHVSLYTGRLAIFRIHSSGYRFPIEPFDDSRHLGFAVQLFGQRDANHAPATVVIVPLLPLAILLSWLAGYYVSRSGFHLGLQWRRRRESWRGFEIVPREEIRDRASCECEQRKSSGS